MARHIVMNVYGDYTIGVQTEEGVYEPLELGDLDVLQQLVEALNRPGEELVSSNAEGPTFEERVAALREQGWTIEDHDLEEGTTHRDLWTSSGYNTVVCDTFASVEAFLAAAEAVAATTNPDGTEKN